MKLYLFTLLAMGALLAGRAQNTFPTTGGAAGIGTTSPKSLNLDIGNSTADTLSVVLARLFEGNATGQGTYLGVRSWATQPLNVASFSIEHRFYGNLNSAITFYRGGSSSGGFLTFSTNNGTEALRIDQNGNVLIAKTAETNSAYKLDVAGPIRANQVVVNSTGADFVFDPGYALPALSDLGGFIRAYHHLPGIASAKQMQAEGMSLGETQTQLLQKVEELTLYAIEADRRADRQAALVEKLEARLDALQEEVDRLKAGHSKP